MSGILRLSLSDSVTFLSLVAVAETNATTKMRLSRLFMVLMLRVFTDNRNTLYHHLHIENFQYVWYLVVECYSVSCSKMNKTSLNYWFGHSRIRRGGGKNQIF